MLRKILATLVLALAALPASAATVSHGGKVVVANRAAGTVSVIDVASDTVIATLDLPGASATPEPMYVVSAARRIFVGDRANDCVTVFDSRTLALLGTIPTGDGVFHMWADLFGRQLWVVNDVDKTLSVISPRRMQGITEVPIPADLAAAGGKPHDVTVDFFFAYVTIVGVDGENDFVVQYDTRTFTERNRAAVGKDPHVSLSPLNRNLFVPAQNGNAVHVLNRWNLNEVEVIPVDGAHGAGMRLTGGVLYTTNLPGGGAGGLVALDARNHHVLGATDTPYPVPHNIALTPFGRKIYVTHSGATADKVTVYTAGFFSPVPVYVGEITVGTNPFGLAYVR